MIDHVFSAVLTFSLLAAGTLLVANEWAAAPAAKVVQLERVVIHGKRLAPAAAVASTTLVEPAAPSNQ